MDNIIIQDWNIKVAYFYSSIWPNIRVASTSNKLISLFTNMAQMTENNGRLIFDYPVNNSDRSSSQIISICRQTRDSISLILFQEFFNYIAGKIVSNIFFDIAYTNGEKKNISHV